MGKKMGKNFEFAKEEYEIILLQIRMSNNLNLLIEKSKKVRYIYKLGIG